MHRGTNHLAVVLMAVLSAAASPSWTEDGVLEEVLVVAQKRVQNLQDVPISVSAFSAKDLQVSGIRDSFDLAAIAPGLDVRQAGNLNDTVFRIRGVGTASNNYGLEPAVGLYVDEVYHSRTGSLVNNLVDVSSVEVLRGPQGTLFGRNTLVGAVLIDTVPPAFDDSNGFAEVTAGNYDLWSVSGAGSITAIDNLLAFRATAFATERDGYVDDVNSGHNEDYNRDRWGTRLQALYTLSASISMRFIADYSKIHEACCANLVVQDNLRPVALPEGATPYAGTDEVGRSLGMTLFTGNQFSDYRTAQNFLPVSENEDSGLSMRLVWDLNLFTLTSITGYREFDTHDQADVDTSDLDAIRLYKTSNQNTWSQELRIHNDGPGLRYVAGLYYFKQDLDNVNTLELGTDINGIFSHGFVWFPGTHNQFPLEAIPDFPYPLVPLFPPNSGAKNNMHQAHEAAAVFGQLDYDITPSLTVTGGLRYNHEEKDLHGVFTQGSAPDFTDNITAPPIVLDLFPAIAPQDPVNESLSDDRVTGNLRLSWFAADNTMLYVYYGTGYKSGGTNTDRINPVFDYVFDPETSQTVEAGLKADFPTRGLRVNLALHSTDIDDLQVNAFDQWGFVLQNAGRVETWGGELEVTWAPTSSLTLTAAYAKTVGEYKDFENSVCRPAAPFHTGQPDPGDPTHGENTTACDRSGDKLDHSPDFLLLTANRAFDISGDIGGFFRVEYSHVGESKDVTNDPYLPAPSYDLLNLRLEFQYHPLQTAVTFWGRNVLDEHYRMGGYVPVQADGRVVATPREPVTYGVTLRKWF